MPAATSRIFANKLGVLPDRVLPALLHDRTIAKGTPLEFITEFFQDYLSTEPIDDLVVLLRKARLDERLLDFFPPQKRSLPELDAHFQVRLQNTFLHHLMSFDPSHLFSHPSCLVFSCSLHTRAWLKRAPELLLSTEAQPPRAGRLLPGALSSTLLCKP